jgi:feruloyl esterase
LPQLGEAVPAAPIGTCEELASRIGSVPDTTIGVIFKVPPSTLPLSNGAAFTLGLNIDQTLLELFATDGTYTESGMSFATPPDASNLSQVRARGGKVLVYHGVSDPIFSIDDSKNWYDRLKSRSGGDDDFARLYPVPGMGHCSGGPATDQADFISPLVAWVERGQAPQALTARARGAGNLGGVNAEVPASWSPGRTRPLCPYPQVARYNGNADLEQAASWTCSRK